MTAHTNTKAQLNVRVSQDAMTALAKLQKTEKWHERSQAYIIEHLLLAEAKRGAK